MTHRFVHVGDVHLLATHPRNADRLQALAQIIDETHAETVSAYLIPGDLFHAKSTVEDRNILADYLQDFAAHAPVVLVRGNHDAIGDLEIFTRLKSTHSIYLATRPEVLRIPLVTGDDTALAAIACLPYPDKAGLVAAGVAKGDVVPTAAELLEVIFMQLAGELKHEALLGAIPLFIGHANIRGSIASTGQPQVGMEQEITVSMLERLPAIYCGMSHIHKAQEVGRGIYAGSIAAMDHGESEAKSFVVIEVEGHPRAWTAAWERRPIDTPKMYHIEGPLTRDGFQWRRTGEEQLPRCGCVEPIVGAWSDLSADRMAPHVFGESFSSLKDCPTCQGTGLSWHGADVRVRYTCKASEKPVIDEQVIRDRFAGALRLKIEGVVIPDRELRAPEVAAAKTLPEKLAAYRKVEQLEPSIEAKLALLDQDAATVERAVAETMKAIETPAPAESVAA